MNGIEGTVSVFELLQVESGILFILLMQMMVSAWKRIHDRDPLVPIPFPRAWITAIVLLFGALTWFFIQGFGTRHTLIAVEFALGVILSLLSPVFAVCFFVSLLFLRPWEIMDYNGLMLAMPRAAGLLAIGSWLLHRLLRFRVELLWDRHSSLLLALGAWVLLSTLKTPAPAESQAEFFATYFRALVVFFLMMNVIRRPEDFALARNTILLSVAGLAMVSLYQSYKLGLTGTERLSAVGILENSNDIAAIMVLALPLALIPLLERRSGPLAMVFGILFTLGTLMSVWQAQSRGAILGILIVAGAWMMIRSKNRKVAILFGLMSMALFFPLTSMLGRQASDLQQSSDSRITYWITGVNMAVRNPLIGVGFNRYPSEFESYASGPLYERGERTAHSAWVLILAETGFPGFILLMTFLFGVFKRSWTVIGEHSELFYSLLGYCVVISFLSHTYLLYPYILFALVLCGARIFANPSAVKEPS